MTTGYCIASIRMELGCTRKQQERRFDFIVNAKPDLATARGLNKNLDRLVKLLERDKVPFDFKVLNQASEPDAVGAQFLRSFTVRLDWQDPAKRNRKRSDIPKPSYTPLSSKQIQAKIAAINTWQWRMEQQRSGSAESLAAMRADELEFWHELERLSQRRERYAPGSDCECTDEELEMAS